MQRIAVIGLGTMGPGIVARLASYTPDQAKELQARRAKLFVVMRRALEDGG